MFTTRISSHLLALGAASTLAMGCDERPGGGTPEGRGLAITVAPLTLPGISEVTYGLTTRNGAGEVVWTRPALSSTRFGNGRGDISYVGPCDAQSNPHTVELLVVSVIDADGVPLQHPTDFFNPTVDADGDPSPIAMTGITCVENADTPVTFNLTVMRAANQGFFDIAVNFDDVFCSAKLDCQEAFLHNGASRAETAVLAFACASGPRGGGDVPPTVMYLSDVTLTCTDAGGNTNSQSLTPTAAVEGNQGAAPPHLYQVGQYFGREGFTDIEKCYWNTALGLDLAAIADQTCVVSAVGTASEGPLEGDVLPGDVVYPVVAWDVTVTDGGALCAPNPLNGEGSGVRTVYHRPGETPPMFSARYPCGGAPGPSDAAPPTSSFTCGDGAVAAVMLEGDQPGFTVTIGDLTSDPVPLPAGATLASSGCCEAACCTP